MARPHKYNLDYFPLDVTCFDDHKLTCIEEEFGFKGGYMAVRIMAMVYQENGYYLEWPDKFEYTVAKRVGNGFTGALVIDILKACIKHGLFSKEIFESFGVVTSRGIQKRWLAVMKGMRRKVEVSSVFWLITSEEIKITSEETTVSATLSTQKEIKGKEIKLKTNSVVPPPAEPVKKEVDKGKKKKPKSPKPPLEETEPYWQKLVEIWFDFYKEKFGIKPSFKDQEPRIFKKLIQLLTKRANDKKFEWSEDIATKSLTKFLKMAYDRKWLKENFLLENLYNQFDVIITPKPTETTAPNFKIPPKQLSKIEKQINQRYCEFVENRLHTIWVQGEDYEYLISKGVTFNDDQKENINTAVAEYISNEGLSNQANIVEPLAKCFAVIEYFKCLQQQGAPTVFSTD